MKQMSNGSENRRDERSVLSISLGIIGGRGRSEISKIDTKFKNNPRLNFFYPILIKKVVAFTTRSVLCDFLKISVITSIYKPMGLYSGGLIHGGAYTRVVLVCGDLGGLIRGGAYTRGGGLYVEFYGIQNPPNSHFPKLATMHTKKEKYDVLH